VPPPVAQRQTFFTAACANILYSRTENLSVREYNTKIRRLFSRLAGDDYARNGLLGGAKMPKGKSADITVINGCGDEMDCKDIMTNRIDLCNNYRVRVQVSVKPYGRPIQEQIQVICNGGHQVINGHICCENKSDSHEFTVVQDISIYLPIQFGGEVCHSDSCFDQEGKCIEER
jgi:hypothetical protein